MFTYGLPGLDIDGLIGFNNNSYCGNNFGFDEFNWENAAGPSQSYTGVEVQGDLNNYPEFPSPSSAPTSLYPAHGLTNNEGYSSQFYQSVAGPSFSQQGSTTYPYHDVYPPIPSLSHSSRSLTPESLYPGGPLTPTYNAHTEPQAVPNLDDLGFGFPNFAGEFSLPMTGPSAPQIPSFGDFWSQCTQPDPLRLDTPPISTNSGATQPEIPLPAPVASSSGPRRTRQSTRETRRHNPVKSTKRKTDSKDGWDQALARFRAEFDAHYDVHYGQPSGGLEPAMALAMVNKFAKDDLKRSPLRDTKAGEGKRSRDVEDYLKGLLKVIRPAPGVVSVEDDTAVAALSRVANELEVTLTVVNFDPALRYAQSAAKPGVGRTERHVRKNGSEKARRDLERYHLERISGFFRTPRQQWSKKDVLSFSVLFLLYGSTPFPRDFIAVRPIA